MMQKKTRSYIRRKTRPNRAFVIYQLTCEITGECYVGITAQGKRTVWQAAWVRVQKHVSRARCEDRAWRLYESLREHGAENFVYEPIGRVVGRAEAYAYEQELVTTIRPALNTQYNKD